MTSSGVVESAPVAGEVLVIGYGNALRRDDAVGVLAAKAVERRALPGVRAIAVLQLVPELAEAIAAVDRVIFVDARACDLERGVEVSLLDRDRGGSEQGLGWTHVASPAILMHLAEHVYGRRPAAWIVSIPAFDLGYGDGLTASAARRLDEAEERIAALIAETS